jgi:hypothetical protein
VFDMSQPGALHAIIAGQPVGTIIHHTGTRGG